MRCGTEAQQAASRWKCSPRPGGIPSSIPTLRRRTTCPICRPGANQEDAKSTDLTDAERASITQQLADPQTVTVDAGYASRDFITDSSSAWAVLDRPAVLACGDAIESFRELISTLEKLILSKTPLVVVAPGIALMCWQRWR